MRFVGTEWLEIPKLTLISYSVLLSVCYQGRVCRDSSSELSLLFVPQEARIVKCHISFWTLLITLIHTVLDCLRFNIRKCVLHTLSTGINVFLDGLRLNVGETCILEIGHKTPPVLRIGLVNAYLSQILEDCVLPFQWPIKVRI